MYYISQFSLLISTLFINNCEEPGDKSCLYFNIRYIVECISEGPFLLEKGLMKYFYIFLIIRTSKKYFPRLGKLEITLFRSV